MPGVFNISAPSLALDPSAINLPQTAKTWNYTSYNPGAVLFGPGNRVAGQFETVGGGGLLVRQVIGTAQFSLTNGWDGVTALPAGIPAFLRSLTLGGIGASAAATLDLILPENWQIFASHGGGSGYSRGSLIGWAV